MPSDAVLWPKSYDNIGLAIHCRPVAFTTCEVRQLDCNPIAEEVQEVRILETSLAMRLHPIDMYSTIVS